MEKTLRARSGGFRHEWQAFRAIILVIVGFGAAAGYPLDQVLATPIERVLGPDKILEHRQDGPPVHQFVTARSDFPAYDDAINSLAAATMWQEHTLGSDLTSTQGRELHQLLVGPKRVSGMIEKFDALNQDGQFTTGSPAHVLDHDYERQVVTGVHMFLPLIDENHAGYDATRSHPLLELGEGSLSRDVAGLHRLRSQFETLARLAQRANGEGNVDQQADNAGQARIAAPLRPLRGTRGCLSGRPLRAKIGVIVIADVLAWLLVSWVFWLFWDLKRPYRIREIAKLLAMSAISLALFVAPIWLNPIWPDPCTPYWGGGNHQDKEAERHSGGTAVSLQDANHAKRDSFARFPSGERGSMHHGGEAIVPGMRRDIEAGRIIPAALPVTLPDRRYATLEHLTKHQWHFSVAFRPTMLFAP